MIIKISFVSLFIILINLNLFAQEDDEILAAAGTAVIKVEDFRDRYEFMPHLNYSGGNPDTLKKEFLYSLIAEKLWSMEAMNENLDTAEYYKYSLKTLKNLFLKDELYRKEVESKIDISPEEISKGIMYLPRILKINIISSEDSSKIYTVYNSLVKGDDHDSLIRITGAAETEIKISFGKLSNEHLEDILFTLEDGEFTRPQLIDKRWTIFRKISEEINDIYGMSSDHKRNAVYSLIKERKANKFSAGIMDKVIGGKTVTADKELFLLLSDNLYSIMKERLTNTKIQLIETDLIKLLRSLDEYSLSAPFVKFGNNSPTIKDFLFYLIYQKVYFSSPGKNQFRSVLSAAVKQFIEDEMLVREAVKEGLENLPSLKKDLQVWKEFFLAEILMQNTIKNIETDETDIAAFREETSKKGGNILQVNIIEILTDNLTEIENILNQIAEGEDFRKLAGEYNKREYTKESAGEWGYFSAASGGEIGKIAANMETGEVYGPLKVPEGYSIFKLLDKRVVSTGIKDTVDSKYIKIQLTLRKMNELINARTAQLAVKYSLSTNQNILNRVEVSPVNTFTYRLIGFGGRVAALPVTIPMFEWYRQYIEERELP